MDGISNGFCISYIGCYEYRLSTGLGNGIMRGDMQLFWDLGTRRGSDICTDDFCTFLGVASCDGSTQARRGAGNKGDFILKTAHCVLRSERVSGEVQSYEMRG